MYQSLFTLVAGLVAPDGINIEASRQRSDDYIILLSQFIFIYVLCFYNYIFM